jgi:GGDEF domain-containing protein
MKLPEAKFSVGVAAFPSQGKTGADLLVAVDAALYRAKQEGGGRVRS